MFAGDRQFSYHKKLSAPQSNDAASDKKQKRVTKIRTPEFSQKNFGSDTEKN